MLCKQEWQKLYDVIKNKSPNEQILCILLSGKKLIKKEIINDEEGEKIKRTYVIYGHEIEEFLLIKPSEKWYVKNNFLCVS